MIKLVFAIIGLLVGVAILYFIAENFELVWQTIVAFTTAILLLLLTIMQKIVEVLQNRNKDKDNIL